MHKLFCDIGMQKILWPEKYDGGGQATPDLALTLAVALEEIGRADTGIAYLLAVNYALGAAVAMAPSPPAALVEMLAKDYCQSGKVVIGSLGSRPRWGGRRTGRPGRDPGQDAAGGQAGRQGLEHRRRGPAALGTPGRTPTSSASPAPAATATHRCCCWCRGAPRGSSAARPS